MSTSFADIFTLVAVLTVLLDKVDVPLMFYNLDQLYQGWMINLAHDLDFLLQGFVIKIVGTSFQYFCQPTKSSKHVFWSMKSFELK